MRLMEFIDKCIDEKNLTSFELIVKNCKKCMEHINEHVNPDELENFLEELKVSTQLDNHDKEYPLDFIKFRIFIALICLAETLNHYAELIQELQRAPMPNLPEPESNESKT